MASVLLLSDELFHFYLHAYYCLFLQVCNRVAERYYSAMCTVCSYLHTVKTSQQSYHFSITTSFGHFSWQEVPQEARPAGVAGGSDHSDGVPHRGQVRSQHHHAAHPLCGHAVLVPGNLPHRHLDPVALLHPVRSGMGSYAEGVEVQSYCAEMIQLLIPIN